ncbi:hypothetical protein SAMN05443144_11633 [Fodinibius roseus]|uniref:Uncharacterized protein n=1 Tax=Fodinibius roseus TaxID=1194090 RepID=A0A1M5G0D7_9BACT|nr:hypothetical protein SAMN05443144_11633 [Fodinibius roseus]
MMIIAIIIDMVESMYMQLACQVKIPILIHYVGFFLFLGVKIVKIMGRRVKK